MTGPSGRTDNLNINKIVILNPVLPNCHLINNNRAVILEGSFNTTISSPTITISLHRLIKTFLMPILLDKRINFLKLLWFKIFTFVNQIGLPSLSRVKCEPLSQPRSKQVST